MISSGLDLLLHLWCVCVCVRVCLCMCVCVCVCVHLQLRGILRYMVRDLGELLAGAVDRGALTAALLWAGQVSEAVSPQLRAVVLRTYTQHKHSTAIRPAERQ